MRLLYARGILVVMIFAGTIHLLAWLPLPALADAEDDKRAWERGMVAIPGNDKCWYRQIGNDGTLRNCLQTGGNVGDKKLPAVVFLHGCAGINSRQTSVMSLFVDAGYATFMPDSMARPDRRRECGQASKYVHLRFDDINYALARIREMPWVDHERLVLAGFSAGGLGAAEYLDFGGVFKARVILGWGCRGDTPVDTRAPYLNLVGRNDGETSRGNQLCGAIGERSEARHVDAGHDVSEDPESVNLIRKFLEGTL